MDNIKQTTDFGPFTPQELERFVTWLNLKKYQYEIIKDQAAEKAFTSNDGSNVLSRGEWRTEVYLAQIFTVRIETLTPPQVDEINQQFNLIEVVPDRFKGNEKVIPFESEADLKDRLEKSTRQKRFWAAVVFIVMVLPGLILMIKNLIKN